RELDLILANYIFQANASVGDSLMATRHIYDYFIEQPTEADSQADDSENSSEGQSQGNAASASDANADQSDQQNPVEVRDDPFSFWSNSQTQEAMPDQDFMGQMNAMESAEQ